MSASSIPLPDSGHESELSWASPRSSTSPSSSATGFSDDLAWITPVSSPLTDISQTRRIRRTRGSSDDSDERASDGFISKDLRVGGPFLCPLPASFGLIPENHPHYDRLKRDAVSIQQDVSQIVRNFGIEFQEIDISALLPAISSSSLPTPVTTVMVTAKRQKRDDNWLQAARALHRHLTTSLGMTGISVEITDPRALERKTCSPVYRSDAIYPMWEKLCQEILQANDISKWTALECFRYGRHKESSLNPPTVIISVLPGLSTDWRPLRDRVVAIIDQHQLHSVAVCIMEDTIQRLCTPKFIPDNACQPTARAGLSLGINEPKTGSGTLGGFVEIQSPQTGRWEVKGLTCFHCVYDERVGVNPKQSHCLDHWKTHEIKPGDEDATAMLKMCQPAWCDIEDRIADLDGIIQEHKTASYLSIEAELADPTGFVPPKRLKFYEETKRLIRHYSDIRDQFERFLNSRDTDLGHVFAGSGLFSVKKSTIDPTTTLSPTIRDWALISLSPNRTPDNTACIYPPAPYHINPLLEYRGMSGTDIPSHGRLYKAGRATHLTSGEDVGLRSVHIHRHIVQGKEIPVETYEHCIKGQRNTRFSRHGDSGAFIFDSQGCVVGLLFGGSEAKYTSYYTHIHDIFADIKEVTGATGVRIMGSVVTF